MQKMNVPRAYHGPAALQDLFQWSLESLWTLRSQPLRWLFCDSKSLTKKMNGLDEAVLSIRSHVASCSFWYVEGASLALALLCVDSTHECFPFQFSL